MLKPISEIKTKFDFNIEECSSSINYFMSSKIDWDVYLPSFGINLQRPFCWDINQKRELIQSVLAGRHIPHCSIIETVDPDNPIESIYQVIDGKQRLSTIIDFVNYKFTIYLEGKFWYFHDLPKDYQTHIGRFYFRYYRVCEEIDKPISDQQKYDWFKFLNFAGTPQEKEHLENLERKNVKTH